MLKRLSDPNPLKLLVQVGHAKPIEIKLERVERESSTEMVNSCKALFVEAFLKDYEHLDGDNDLHLKDHSVREYLERTAESTFQTWLNNPSNVLVVARHDNSPMGFAIFDTSERLRIYVVQLAVSPSFRGQKIGEHLLALGEMLTESANEIWMVTRAINLRAIGFYEHLGYQATSGQREGYATEIYRTFSKKIERNLSETRGPSIPLSE